MAEMPEIDPNFEPQSRPRLGTWPLNRPNIQARRNRGMEMGGTFLDATLEEANSQELIADGNMMMEPPPLMKDDYLSLLSPDSMLSQTDLDSVLLGSPPAPNLVTDFSALSGTNSVIKQEPNNNTIIGDYCTQPTMTELSNLDESQRFQDAQTMQKQNSMQIHTTNTVANFSSSSTLSKSPTNTVSTAQSIPGATQKAKSSRKNAWGNMSYADLITQAIEASPEKRLTLAQIYEWMVKNVAYFKDKGDSNSSAGWKNSIRHNLSLHAKFKRNQNEGTGKSSWWVINHDAKPGKSPRRPRAISMDNASAKYNRSRSKVLAKQKADLLKKQKAGLTSGLEATVSKALGNEYRQRAGSSASSLGGRLSPQGRFLSQDLEDDGAPSLSISSPLSGSTNNLALSTSLPVPSAFNNIFEMTRQDAASSIPETISTDQLMHENLLESLASMDVVSSPGSAYQNQAVLQQINGVQNPKNMGTTVAQNSPNLASLLQKTPVKGTNNKILQKNTTKPEPQWNDSKTPYPYSDYQNQQMMSQVMQSPPQYKSQMQSTPMGDGKPLYHYLQQPQDNTQYTQQVNYISQAPIQQYMTDQQRQQMVPTENSQTPQYQASNLLQMSQAKFPSDINLDNQELYDSGDLDMNEVLRDMPSSDYPNVYNFGMEFESGGKPASFYNQLQSQMTQETGTYNTGMSGNAMIQQQQSQQPAMHPNPDIFIANPGSGTTSMDMMMDGCRMNNANFQRMQGGQQPSSVGAAPSYSMQ